MVLNRLSSNLGSPSRTLAPVAAAKKAASSKTSSLGIGKAPASRTSRKRKTHVSDRRRNSVKRAKLSENADTPAAPIPTHSGPATNPAFATAATASEATHVTPAAQAHIHIQPPQPPQPQPSVTSVKVPPQLARPNLAPIRYVNIGGDDIPAAYVLHKLGPHLPYLLRTSTFFIPYPSVPSPEGHTTMASRKSFPFGIRDVIEGLDGDGKLRSKTDIYKPDACLAIRQRNGSFILVPATKVVYATQCVHFTTMPDLDLQTDFVSASFETPPTTAAALPDLSSPGCDQSVSQCGAVADADADDAQADEDDACSVVSSIASSASDCSESSEASSVVPLDAGGYVHLPVIALDLPHPESFLLIHTRLHFPNRKWQPLLLRLKTAEAQNPLMAYSCLSILPFDEIQNRMRMVHGVWQNMVSLGIVDDAMWNELTSAWCLFYQVLVAHAKGELPVRLP